LIYLRVDISNLNFHCANGQFEDCLSPETFISFIDGWVEKNTSHNRNPENSLGLHSYTKNNLFWFNLDIDAAIVNTLTNLPGTLLLYECFQCFGSNHQFSTSAIIECGGHNDHDFAIQDAHLRNSSSHLITISKCRGCMSLNHLVLFNGILIRFDSFEAKLFL